MAYDKYEEEELDSRMKTGMVDEEVVDVEETEDDSMDTFEDEMMEKVLKDFTQADEYMTPFHQAVLERHKMYHNSHSYEDLRKKDMFPVPFYQEQIDVFVSDMADKLFYKNRPCTVSGVTENDREDASVKQEMLDWQDYQDKVHRKITSVGKDGAMYGICIAQVDYKEEYTKKIVSEDVPAPVIGPEGGPVLDPMGNPVPQIDPVTGAPILERVNQAVDHLLYKGPTVKRVDPLNLFIPEDKVDHNDGVPIIIRSFHNLEYFKSRPYFFNYEKIKEARDNSYETKTGGETRSSGMVPDYADQKRQHRGYNNSTSAKKRVDYEYLEWHGPCNRNKLYEYLQMPIAELDEEGNEMPLFDDDEMVYAIIGIVDKKTIVRLEETPFEFNGPNVIIGYIQPEEDDAIGTSISDKIFSVQKGLEVLTGMNLENFKQSIKAGHVINKSAVANGGDVLVNKAGQIIWTNQDVRAAHKRIEQPKLAPEIINLFEYFKGMGREASGVSKLTSGYGDDGAETLGEANLVAGQSSLRMKTYLKSFEETFVQPLYEMRNQINMQFLDEEYIYGVIEDGVVNWRKATPAQIRANVDFVCESSVRETNRAVITQQILQFAQIAPLAIQLGFPIRLDVLFGKLMEQGFSWTTEQVHEVIPSLKMESEQGIDINGMLLQTFLTRLIMQGAMPQIGGGPAPAGTTSPMEEIPQPTSENGANVSNQARNSTQLGAL